MKPESQQSRVVRFRVDHQSAGMRLSCVVAANVRGLSVRKAKGLVDRGRVFVDQQRVLKASTALKGGEQVEAYLDRPVSPPDLGRDQVVWMDRNLVAVNKPPGLPVYGTRGTDEDTVIPRLKRLLQAGGEWARRDDLLLVHRLDRDTSGLLLLARNATAARSLEEQFFQHAVEKRYRVVVQGIPRSKSFRCSSVVRAKRVPGSPKELNPSRRQSAHAGDKKAVTSFKVMETFDGSALLEAKPFTGHTHQIRIHLEEAGHPVLGDVLYGTRAVKDARFRAVPRQMLHAYSLGFDDPDTGRRVVLRAPVPRDMEQVLNRLRGR